MPQRVKPWTYWRQPSLSVSMSGAGAVGGEPGEGYTLADATAGLPFAISTPTPPTITSEATVTPATFSANNVDGRRLILGAGDYSGVSLGGTDKEIVLTTGVNILGQLSVSGQRIIVRADPPRTGTINYWNIGQGATDILFDGIYTDSTALSDESNMLGRGNRIAIINSRMRTNWFVLVAYPDSGNLADFIVANNDMDSYGGTQAAVRLHSLLRFAFVDNLQKSTGGNATFRLHTNGPPAAKSDFLYVGRNQFEGAFWQIRPVQTGTADPNNTDGMGTVWVENNNVYFNGLWWINMGELLNNDFPEVFIQRNNNAYIASGSWKEDAYGAAWDYTSENNTVAGYTSPPVWEHQ